MFKLANTFIENVEILNLHINFHCPINVDQYDVGALTMCKDGREFILDSVNSQIINIGGGTVWMVLLDKDVETFPDCKYDLTAMDVLSDDIECSFYFGGEGSIEPDSISLFVKYGDMTKAINVTREC